MFRLTYQSHPLVVASNVYEEIVLGPICLIDVLRIVGHKEVYNFFINELDFDYFGLERRCKYLCPEDISIWSPQKTLVVGFDLNRTSKDILQQYQMRLVLNNKEGFGFAPLEEFSLGELINQPIILNCPLPFDLTPGQKELVKQSEYLHYNKINSAEFLKCALNGIEKMKLPQRSIFDQPFGDYIFL